MRYYAAHYPYGYAVSANTGRVLRTVHSFLSRADRDAYVAARNTDLRTNSGYREALPARQVTRREREEIVFDSDAEGRPV